MAEYGEEVLADPGTGGFNVDAVARPDRDRAARGRGHRRRVKRWRGAPEDEAELPPPLSPEDARRLDADLGT